MEISSKYNPLEVEDKWYKHWMDKDYFSSKPDEREPFTIVIPPPNVTGRLHMGHMLNNTIQDVLIRRARMQGKNACWVPGTDHASIATEAKVVQRLRKQGIKKTDIGRAAFLKHAHEWKDEFGGIILQQLRKLGASCDWKRERFTMDENYSKQVIKVFVNQFNKGYIFRGLRMINWDTKAKTALSNEEVIHTEEQSKLYYVNYRVKSDKYELVTIATTRPETILGDTAIAVHPDDERYKHLIGKTVWVPLVYREIPIIADDYVDMEFGTGCLKITPAHDANDYELGKKHNLEIIDIMNDDGTLSEAAQRFIGRDRFEVRDEIVDELFFKGHIFKIETFTNKIGRSERTNVIVEPKLSLQWFLDMKKIVKPALDNVMNDEVQLVPSKFKNTYKYWMENIRDWCLSRQLWWGHQIPAYFFGDGENDVVVAETKEEALELAKAKSGNSNLTLADLKQDEDVLDTWASSWIWPIAVFDGFLEEGKKEIDYYYPTNVLVTGWDIIFLWVARMVLSGYEFKNEKPFQHVYFTGMVRDLKRRKMSKQLGNSPEPMDLIEKFGADGVRMGMLLSAPAGNDLLFNEKLVEQGRNFCNKIWNALRLIKGWETYEGKNEDNETALIWFENKLNDAIINIDKSIEEYRLSEAIMTIYTTIWDDFCSWFLEMIKPEYGSPIDSYTLGKIEEFYEIICRVIHPFMPFISEEIYHNLKERSDDVCVAKWPEAPKADETILNLGEQLKELVTKIRETRAKVNLPKKDMVTVYLKSDTLGDLESYIPMIKKLAGVEKIELTLEEMNNLVSFVSNQNQFFVDTGVEIDKEAEKAKLQKDLEYSKGLINIINKKLSNEKFVANAPEALVEKERNKRTEAEEKVKMIEEQIAKF